MKKILEIKNLTKYYGDILGIKDLNLDLYENEIFGYIGPNGSGKSTTIRSIMNLINKDGKVLFNGKLLTKDCLELKKDIGYLPSEINLYEDLIVKEMIDYHISFYKKDLNERRKYLVNKLKLDETKKVSELSLGNLKKLGIVLALIHEPKLLILDEPTSGLDPIMQEVFYGLLREEVKRGATVFYSTHILSEISKVCDRVGIIKDGRLLKIESIKELQSKSLNIVTIKSKDIEKIVSDLNINVEIIDNGIRFNNDIEINKLLSLLSKYEIDNLLIEEATLEDIFLHYYE